MVNYLEITQNKPFNLEIWNDVHLGALACEKDLFKKTIEAAKKENSFIILNGDLIDAIHTSDVRFNIDEVDAEYTSVQDQYVGMRKLLMPIKDKIIAVGDGNHERKIKKTSGLNLSKLFADDFNAMYFGDVLVLKVNVGKTEYRILILHSYAGGTSLIGHLSAIKKYSESMEKTPDVVVMGHVHRLDVIMNPKLTDKFNTKVKYLVINGSYFNPYKLGKDNYVTQNFFPPSVIGNTVFTFAENSINYKFRMYN